MEMMFGIFQHFNYFDSEEVGLRILHAHTLTRLLNGSAHETQSVSTELLENKKSVIEHFPQQLNIKK